MVSKTLLIIILVNVVSDYSYGQRHKKFFRKDYTYIEDLDGFYKIHTLQKSWFEAKRMCALEGASFFYPENEYEAQAVISFWNNTLPITSVYVGISDLVAKGVFETINGQPVSEVFKNWGAGEPNDAYDVEDCVILRIDGTLNDVPCDNKNYFICKKSLFSLEWNQPCNIPNLDYTFDKDIGKCYKLHTTPLNWMQAHAVCRAEQTYLAVINNQLEADYLANFTKTASNPSVEGDYFRGIYHLGFHNRLQEGWLTVRGTPMTVDTSAWWNSYKPRKDDREQCGSMFYNGRLNIINCDTKSFFICEHEVPHP